MLHAWGRLLAARARTVLVLGLLLTVLAGVFGVGAFERLSNGGFEDPASEASQAATAEREAFGRNDADVIAVYSDDTLEVESPEFRAAVTGVVDSLPADAVESAVTWYDQPSPALVSDDGRATTILLTLTGESQDDLSTSYDEVRPYLDADGLQSDVGGPWAVFGDVNTTVSEDIARAEMLSMPIVLLLCLVLFGGVVAALMPFAVGVVAIVGALAVVRLITNVGDVSVFAINVITLLGLGLAIDYALFVVNRFREELALRPGEGREGVDEAVAATVATAGRTVMFSGLIVAASLASLLIFPQNFLRSMGYGGVAAVLVAMTAALTLLPATLAVLGRRIDAGRLPWRRGRRRVSVDGSGAWARLARSVMRRPVVYLSVVVVALFALATPFLGVSWGSVDHRVLPPDAPSRVTAELVADDFGGERSSASVVISGADEQRAAAYLARLRTVTGVDEVRPVDTAGVDGVPTTLAEVSWSGNAQEPSSQQLVGDLRAVDPGPDVDVLVGGTSAETVDLIGSVGDHLPWMGLVVVAVMLVLLFVAFGSVVLPIKAVLMNAVSVVASFGVVTWIFADGNLSELLGFTPTGYLDVTQPILMLAILFGLSMDYEVFLLSRVREQWDATHDNTESVALGLQRTGAIITGAALLLSVVIGAFATSGIVFMKMIGVGMLVALLIDATVVRALLVPATMKLLGAANWWAPAPLRTWWERHGLRETPAVGVPAARRFASSSAGAGPPG